MNNLDYEEILEKVIPQQTFKEEVIWESNAISILKYDIDNDTKDWIKIKYNLGNVVIIPYITNENNRVIGIGLLNEFNPARTNNYAYTLVTGTEDPTDETPLSTAIRELAEETGYYADIDRWTYLGELSTNKMVECNHSCFAVNINDLKPKKISKDKIESLSTFKIVSLNEAIKSKDAYVLSLILKIFIFQNYNAYVNESTINIESFQLNESEEKKNSNFKHININVNIDNLTENEIEILNKLIEISKLADEIFWQQYSNDGIELRNKYKDDNEIYHKILDNYGPYDALNDDRRFIGEGSEFVLPHKNFYPVSLSKDEIDYIKSEDEFKNPYTVIRRENNELKAYSYSEYYDESKVIVNKLRDLSNNVKNLTFKKYLLSKANDIENNNFEKSFIDWMNIKDSNLSFIIGPIESYDDKILNLKASYEAILSVKDTYDNVISDNIDKFIDNFEVPDKQKSMISKVDVSFENIIYLAGSPNRITFPLATTLPNMKSNKRILIFKNNIEAKFQNIHQEIADLYGIEIGIDEYINFISLHELGHTFGPFINNNDENIKEALENNYSTIEELKADLLSVINNLYLYDNEILSKENLNKFINTYIIKLFAIARLKSRSHYKTNLIELNYLLQNEIIKIENEKLFIDYNKFTNIKEFLKEVIDGILNNKVNSIIENYSNEETLNHHLSYLEGSLDDLKLNYVFEIK